MHACLYEHLLDCLTYYNHVYIGNATFCSFVPQALNTCQGENVDADFVYFGCGLRLLQLIPERSLSWNALDT